MNMFCFIFFFCLKFSMQFDFCFPLTRVRVMNTVQRKKIRLVGKILN